MGLLDFIDNSPTAYQAVENIKEELLQNGATVLSEDEKWNVERGRTYVVTRNGSALVSFCIPENAQDVRVFAAHADSPSFKLKENPEIVVEEKYVKLNIEAYGGMLMATWFDRPLSVAGRVIVKEHGHFVQKLVNIDRDILIIPSVCIHMNREANNGYKYNVQTDLLPLFGVQDEGKVERGAFMKIVAENAGVQPEDILGQDLFLYVREKGRVWGAKDEFISAPHIDDLECAYAGLQGFLNGRKEKHIAVLSVFDNEEVGSRSIQGAGSTFLKDVLERIGVTKEMISKSLMFSADNGHALHPNHPELTDPTNRPVLNGGVLLKYAARLSYATDGLAAAFFKDICQKAGVPYQVFFNRSDIQGGGTLGAISTSQVPFLTADIGLAQLSMHSAYETAGARDFDYMVRAAGELFS